MIAMSDKFNRQHKNDHRKKRCTDLCSCHTENFFIKRDKA